MRWHHIAVNLRTFTCRSNLIGLAKCLSIALCAIFSLNCVVFPLHCVVFDCTVWYFLCILWYYLHCVPLYLHCVAFSLYCVVFSLWIVLYYFALCNPCNPCKPWSLQRNAGSNIRPEPVWCFCPQYLTSQKSWWKPREPIVFCFYLQPQIDVPLSNMWIKKVWLMALSDHLSTSVIICYLRWPHTLSEDYLRWPNAHSENSHSLQLMRPAGTWEEFNPRIQKAIQYKTHNCAPGKNSHGME